MHGKVVRALVAVAALGVTGALVAGTPASARDGKPFRIPLSGANEFNAAGAPINPHGAADRGMITIWLDARHERVCWKAHAITLTAGDALPFAAHIHQAAPGVAGPIRVDLFGTATTPAAPTRYPTRKHCVGASAAQINAIRGDLHGYYVNLHNAQHPGGVMRGQLDT